MTYVYGCIGNDYDCFLIFIFSIIIIILSIISIIIIIYYITKRQKCIPKANKIEMKDTKKKGLKHKKYTKTI